MFTALVLVCNLDVVSADQCFTSMSNNIFETKEMCIKDLIMAFDAGAFRRVRTDGVVLDMVAYECVEWEPGKNI